ncbi:MAG: ASCH domain-containing protein [Ideonella sp.]|nr:ASCH domain-containing protein [Ideonella sp.]
MAGLPEVAPLVERLAALGITLPPGRVTVDGYGDSPGLSEELLALICSGRKRAGTGLLWAYEREGQPLPAVGDIEIVVDHHHAPALVTRVTRVQVLPYGEVSAGYAAIEGEGDGSLAEWRRHHWAFFGRECARLGLEPSESMPVVCGEFELLFVVPPGP